MKNQKIIKIIWGIIVGFVALAMIFSLILPAFF
jgi:hypothetical protein